MNQTKSSNEKTTVSLGQAMRPLWRAGIPTTMALSALIAIAFAVALDGCSRTKSNKTNVATSSTTSAISNNLSAAIPSPSPTDVKPAVTQKKKSAVERPSTVGYADGRYGVSFRYPRTYTLLSPDNVRLNQSMSDIPMNFVQPGGVEVATIGLSSGPANSLFKVSVNRGLTAQQCEQFADPDVADVTSNSPVDTSDPSIPSKVSLRGVDFSLVENGTEQNDLRYYHHFETGACYEFVMAVEEADGNAKPMDHFELFDKLERILATVKMRSEVVPAVTANAPSSPTSGTNPQ
ncbi:MAG TPA: hypothetical protein VIX19_05930 [Terriglobales bacterium]